MFADSYERKLKGNSLILSELGDFSDDNVFEERMICENRIKGFLPCSVRVKDDTKQFIYDITSRQNYSSLFEEKEMKEKDIIKLISGLVSVRNELSEYLLDDNNLVLNPQFLYADPETRLPNFVFYPYYNMDIKESLSQLGLFILERTDHEDENAVSLAYGFYKYITKEDYAFEKLLQAPSAKPEKVTSDDREVIEESEPENSDFVLNEKILDLQEENIHTERIVLIVSSVVLVLLILVILGLKFWGFEKIIPVSNTLTAGIICLVGAMAVSAPVAILINKIRSENIRYGYETMTEDILKEKLLKKNRKFVNESAFGKTGEMNIANCNRLVCYDNDNIIEFKLGKNPFIIGKSRQEADGYLDFPGASRIHARIDVKGEDCFITDCNSTNGTSVNGHMLTVNECMKLHENDEVSFAGKVFYFR